MDYLKLVVSKLLEKKSLFLTGGAGVGKTTITREVIAHFECEAKKVAKLASTGMASTLIGGQTLHSFFDLGICKDIEDLELKAKFKIKPKLKKLLSKIDLIVIDEISMVSDKLFEMIELRMKQADFKGSLMVVGDFLQLPPVVRGSDEVEFAFNSPSWLNMDFEIVELTHIYRTDDREFIELLHEIRYGNIDEQIHNRLNQYIRPLPNSYSEFTVLFGKNISASKHNVKELSFIDEELHIKEYEVIKHSKSINEKDIQRFMNDAKIEQFLELKIGAPLLFTRNSWNYFNGERGVLVNIDSEHLYIKKSDEKVIKVERVSQSKSIWKEKSVDGAKEMVEEELFSIYQYPIRLAFAITIHKSQGMSIENLIIDTNEIFAPSQFYVAISRCSNPSRLNLIAPRKQWYELCYVNHKALEFSKKLEINHES